MFPHLVGSHWTQSSWELLLISLVLSGGSLCSSYLWGRGFISRAWVSIFSLPLYSLILTAVSFSCFLSFVLFALPTAPPASVSFTYSKKGRWRQVLKFWGMDKSVLLSYKLLEGKRPCYSLQSINKTCELNAFYSKSTTIKASKQMQKVRIFLIIPIFSS